MNGVAVMGATQGRAINIWGFTASEAVDVHCHCLPGLDDGPQTPEAALLLCNALVADGITTVIATPHQMGRYDRRNNNAQVRAAVASLNALLTQEGIPLHVEPGADVRVDERIPKLLRDDRVLSLADRGRHILLELPHETFVDLRELLAGLLSQQVTGIITHPERHPILRQRLDILQAWTKMGAAIQITAASLLGQAGPTALDSSWKMVEAGLVDIVASDAHDHLNRPPLMGAAARLLVEKVGAPIARLLCIENPIALLHGHPLASLRRTVLSGGRA